MKTFCSTVTMEIKAAKGEFDLIKVIGNSMYQLRKERTSFNESMYLMSMIINLRTINPNEVTEETRQNIKLAIAIFRQFQNDNAEMR